MSRQIVKQGDSAKIALIVLKNGSTVDLSGANTIKAVLRSNNVEVGKFSSVSETGFDMLSVSGEGNNIVTLFAPRSSTKEWTPGKMTATLLCNFTDSDFPDTGRDDSYSFSIGDIVAADPDTVDEVLP